MPKLKLHGVVVATVLPFAADGSIDWPGFGRVLDYCARPDGVTAVFVNGHAGEGASLTPAERIEVITFTRRHLGPGKPILAGIIALSTDAAIEQAQQAEAAGADCAVLFPLAALGNGACATPRAPLAYLRSVAEAISLPISIFQYPLGSGLGYSTETLVAMARTGRVVAIKEGSDIMAAYEDNWRQVKDAAPDVAILPSNYNWFLAQLAVGGDGVLSGLASLTPHLLIELWRAAQAADLTAMRKASALLYPVVRTIYGRNPLIDMHTRIKVGLQHLGIIADPTPRPPLLPVTDDIRAEIERTVRAADLPGVPRASV